MRHVIKIVGCIILNLVEKFREWFFANDLNLINRKNDKARNKRRKKAKKINKKQENRSSFALSHFKLKFVKCFK